MKKVGGAICSLKSGILNDFKHVKLEIDLYTRTNRTLHLLILEMGGFTFGKKHSGEGPRFTICSERILTKKITHSRFI